MRALILFSLLCATTVLSEDLSSLEHYCYVQSPTDFKIFNLTTLYNDAYDCSIRLNDVEYLRVRFCGPLKSPCNGKQDYAVCLHSNDKEVEIGREPPKVAVEYDKIMLRYRGDKCNDTHNYTLDVELKCNFSMKDKIDENLDIVYNRDECGFQITLQTPAACAEGKQTTCDLKNESGYFNLKPLMELTRNYIIKLNQNLSVILNICHSLIYGQHFSQCGHDTMVCLVDETIAAEPSFTRLGNINNDVRISASNGYLYLDLTSDTPCDGQENIRTTIEFVCKENATNKLPQYTSGFGTCHYKFTWVTAAACSEDTLIKQSEVNHQPCKITDPLYNRLFDLSMLEGNVTYVNSTDKSAEYQFSVCSPLQKSNCTKEGTGVCKYIKGNNIAVSKGQANTNLMWRSNYVFLNYTDGVACESNRRSYTTIIFKCARFNNTLLIDDHDPCATIITWQTPMICDHRCATPNYQVDFNSLRDDVENYVVPGETPGTSYYMNICEPLVDDDFTNCTYGTGICKVILNQEGERISEINLGYAETGLRTTPDGRIYLSHVNGSVCEEDPSKRISSEITFTCDGNFLSIGPVFFLAAEYIFTPETLFNYLDMLSGIRSFEGYNNCKYDFIWKTDRLCPVEDIRFFAEDCLPKGSIKNFNLHLLIENYRFKINTNESTGYFNGSACGDLHKCHGTFVCDNWPKNRKNLTPKLDRLPKLVVFKFANKIQCKNETFLNSWFTVWCHLHEGNAESFLVKEECSIGLNWDDSFSVCEFESNGVNAGIVILIIVAVVLFVLIVITLCFCGRRTRGIMCIDALHNVMARCMNYILVREDPEEENDDIALEERS